MRCLTTVSGVVLVLAAGHLGSAALISPGGYDEHWVRTNDYTEEYNGVGQQHGWTAALDGADHGATASFNGSTAVGASKYGDPNGSSIVLRQTWDMDRAAGGDYGNSVWAHARYSFTVQEDLAYSISGFFFNSAGNTEFDVVLTDVTHGPFNWLMLSRHRYSPSGTGMHIVGGEPDAYLNYFTGSASMSGILHAGTTYEFASSAISGFAAPGGDGGAEACGEAVLTLTRLNAVPEPASLTLFGLGALGMAAGRRRLRRPNSRI